MSIADFFFGRKQNSTNSRRSVKLNRNAVRTRTLSMEPLETRDLLSVTTGYISDSDYSALRTQYPDFNLPENQSTLNVMVVDLDEGATALKLEDLKTAISNAVSSTKPDLILVKTTDSANTITYTSSSDEITINISASQYGSVTIIGWGTKELTLNANRKCRVMSIKGKTDLNFANTTFTNGKVAATTYNVYGGGLYIESTGSLFFSKCTISNNSISSSHSSSQSSGGGIYSEANNSLIFTNCLIYGNSASSTDGSFGAGIAKSKGTLMLNNCIISNNSAPSTYYPSSPSLEIGGIYSRECNTTIINSTITHNSSLGVYAGYSSVFNIYNSIIVGNSSIDIDESGNAETNAYNTLSSYNYWSNSSNNIVYDSSKPLFVSSVNYHLADNSQAINKGKNSYATGQRLSTDLAGIPRIIGGTVDLGAYEYDSRTALSVPEFSVVLNGTVAVVNVSPVENAAVYRIEYSLNNDFTDRTTIDALEGENSLEGLQKYQTYYIRVKSVGNNVYADSDYSEVQTITIAETLNAHNDFVNTTLNSPVVIDYRENDEATDWSVVTVQFGEASHGEYVVNEDGTISYTPEIGFFGTDTIGYVLFSSSSKASVGSISISIGLPIATSVQKTSSSHSPSTAMAPSVDSLTDWENCCIELWAQGVNELNSGETTVTLEYNPAVYEVPYFSACAEGVALAASEGVVLPNGNVEIQLTVHVLEPIESQTDNLFLGTVVLTPSEEEGSGVEDGSNVPACILEGVELTTTVEAMPYDLVRNGAVDVNDFVAFATVFGTNLETMSPDNPLYAQALKADFNNDKIVNVDDFVMFAIKFGATKKRVEIPAAQASAAADSVRSEELGVRSSASVINVNSEDAPVSDVSLLLPQNEVESSMTLLEAYSAALLDLYDNQESFDQTEPSAVLAESKTELPVANYSDGASPNTPFDAVDAVLEEDLLAIDWR